MKKNRDLIILLTIIHALTMKPKPYINNLKAVRVARGWKQKDVAEALGLFSQDRLCHWETSRSEPPLIFLLQLCALYDIPLTELYTIQSDSFSVAQEVNPVFININR